MAINFRQLEVFRAVAEIRSFTRASQTLFISQSTVSQHIRELEEYLGIRLFERNRRNVSLTVAGETLLEHSQNIFRMIGSAEAATKQVCNPYRGKLSLGCASTTLLYHLPDVLGEYTRRYPDVELQIIGGTVREIGMQMLSESLDLALVVPPLSTQALEKVVLFVEPFVLVLPAAHPLASRHSLRIEDVEDERFVLNRRGQNTRRLIDRFLFAHRVTPRVAIELAETEPIKAMVARGLGVSLLPRSAFRDRAADQQLKTYPIPRQELCRTLAAVYPRPGTLRPPATAMLDLLKTYFLEKQKAER
jgi:DNA-binding transcriptional LysR family regulator